MSAFTGTLGLLALAPFELVPYLGIVVASVLGGLVIFWAFAGWYHWAYYVRRAHDPEQWKCQPRRFLRPGQNREAALLSTMNLTIGGVISGTMIDLIRRGMPTPIYFEVERWGWAWTIVSPVLLFLMVDAAAYYSHRALHGKWAFRHIHRWHHRYIATTPFVTIAMHPAEFLFFQACTFVPLFVLPVHYVGAIAVFIYVLVYNIVDHSGIKLASWFPWQAHTQTHDDHHAHFHVNFGQHLTLWDRLHGTARRGDRRYGVDVFGGKGAPIAGARGDDAA